MSIVIGLGIARILSGFSALIEARREIESDAVTIFWAVNVLGYSLLFWWIVVNNWRFLSEWSFSQFGSLFLYGVLIFFCASLILPQNLSAGVDLKVRFESIRKPFYVLWLLVMCSEFLDSVYKGWHYVLNELGPVYLAMITISLLLSVGGILISDRRFQLFAPITFFMMYSAWMLASFSTI